MKRILILNQGMTDNYGDIAINRVITDFIRNHNYIVDCEIFWSEEKAFGNNYKKFPKILKWILWNNVFLMDYFNKKYINKYFKRRNYDYIIIGGGELLGLNYGFNSSLYLWTKIAKRKNIPVIIYGVSGTPDISKFKLIRNKISLKRCSEIYVRDNATKAFIKKNYLVNSKCYPDCVFAYKLVVDNNKYNSRKDSVLIAPIVFYKDVAKGLNLNNENEYFNLLYEILLKELKYDEINNIIVTCSEKGDENTSKKFYYYLKNKNINKDIEFYNYSFIENFIVLLNKSKVVISGRMHAMILGKIYGCNIKPLRFKDKLIVFDEEYKNNNSNIEKKAYESLVKLLEFLK